MIEKTEPEPDPLDPRSTVQSPIFEQENYVSAGKCGFLCHTIANH